MNEHGNYCIEHRMKSHAADIGRMARAFSLPRFNARIQGSNTRIGGIVEAFVHSRISTHIELGTNLNCL